MNQELIAQLEKQYGENLVQCDEFPHLNRIQIVLKMKPEKKTFNGKELDSYTRDAAIWQCTKVLQLCSMNKLQCDLRLALKLQNGVTVTDMIFSKDAIDKYLNQDLESIAEYYHIASGLK